VTEAKLKAVPYTVVTAYIMCLKFCKHRVLPTAHIRQVFMIFLINGDFFSLSIFMSLEKQDFNCDAETQVSYSSAKKLCCKW
jgi:hypothetical protein